MNIVNLLLARGVAREQETALRAALGAGRWRLVRQVLTENMMLVLAGGTLGVLLAYALVNAISRTSAIDVPRLQYATLSWPVLLFSVGVCAGCTVLLSILPAAHSYHGVATWLKTSAGTTAGTGARRWHGALVVCELALVMVPLTGAGLMLRSLSNVWAESAASMPRQVLMTRVQASGSPDLDERFYRARDGFSEPRFKALYRVWKEDGDTAFAVCRSHALDEAVAAGAGRVETLELGHRYGHLSPLVAVA